MRWYRLARKDVGDALRSWSLYGTVGIFVVLCGLIGYFSGEAAAAAGETSFILPLTLGLMSFLVPIVALGLTYESVAGPRSTGSLQFLLALPYSRRDVVLGTYAGRAVVLGAGVAAGYLALSATLVLRGVVPSPVELLVVAGAVFAFGIVYVAIGLGISTAVRSTTIAGTLVFLIFFLFLAFWGSIPTLVASALKGFEPARPPDWAPLFRTLNPNTAYEILVGHLLGVGESSGFGTGRGVVRSLPLAGLVLTAWATLPPLAGYLRFRTQDL